jgi:hypothetical protein
LDALDISFNFIHSNLIGLIDGVPNTEIVAILSDNDVRVGDPADILAVVEQGLLFLFLDIVQVKLTALIPKEQLVATWVELKIVNLAVMRDVSQH